MTTRQSFLLNGFDNNLAEDVNPADLTIEVLDDTLLPEVPFYLVINPFNDNQREYMLCTDVVGTTLVVERQLEGSQGDTHQTNNIVRFAWNKQHLDDLWGIIDGIVRNLQTAPYTFRDATTGDPSAGEWQRDNVTVASVTELFFAQFDELGEEHETLLANLRDGDVITVASLDDAGIETYNVLGPGVLAGGVYTVPVELGSTSGPAFVDGDLNVVGAIFGRNLKLDGLSDVDVDGVQDLQVLGYNADTLEWVPITNVASKGITVIQYLYDANQTVIPAAGDVSPNNASPALTTNLAISNTDANGDDADFLLDNLKAGDIVVLARRSNTDDQERYDVVSSTDVGIYHDVEVTFISSTGTINDNDPTFLFYFQTLPDLDDVYLRLDTTNDPLTGALRMGGNALEMQNAQITGVVNPSADDHAMPRLYADNRYVNLTGDTMQGVLTLFADPLLPLEAATKQYVDAVEFDELYLRLDSQNDPLVRPRIIIEQAANFPGIQGVYARSDDHNVVDADTSHLFQGAGTWDNQSGVLTREADDFGRYGFVTNGFVTGGGNFGIRMKTGDDILGGDGIPVEGSTEYVIRLEAEGDTDVRWRFQLSQFDAAGVELVNLQTLINLDPSPVDTPTLLSATVVTEPTAAFVQVMFRINDSQGGGSVSDLSNTKHHSLMVAKGTDDTFVPSIRIVGVYDVRTKLSAVTWIPQFGEYLWSTDDATSNQWNIIIEDDGGNTRLNFVVAGITNRQVTLTEELVGLHELKSIFDPSNVLHTLYVDDVLIGDSGVGGTQDISKASAGVAIGDRIIGGTAFDGAIEWAELRDGEDGPLVRRYDAIQHASQDPVDASWLDLTGSPWDAVDAALDFSFTSPVLSPAATLDDLEDATEGVFLPLAGGTLTGELQMSNGANFNMGGGLIYNVNNLRAQSGSLLRINDDTTNNRIRIYPNADGDIDFTRADGSTVTALWDEGNAWWTHLTHVNMNANRILFLADPVSDQDAATKFYVDDRDALYLPLSGGSGSPMSGDLHMGMNDIVDVFQILWENNNGVTSGFATAFPGATREVFRIGPATEGDATYIQMIGLNDTSAAEFGFRIGGTEKFIIGLTQLEAKIDLHMNGANNRVRDMADPALPQDAATKAYVDQFTGGSIDHDNLTNVTEAQHHARYTDGEAVGANTGIWLSLGGGTLTGQLTIQIAGQAPNVPADTRDLRIIGTQTGIHLQDSASTGVVSFTDIRGFDQDATEMWRVGSISTGNNNIQLRTLALDGSIFLQADGDGVVRVEQSDLFVSIGNIEVNGGGGISPNIRIVRPLFGVDAEFRMDIGGGDGFSSSFLTNLRDSVVSGTIQFDDTEALFDMPIKVQLDVVDDIGLWINVNIANEPNNNSPYLFFGAGDRPNAAIRGVNEGPNGQKGLGFFTKLSNDPTSGPDGVGFAERMRLKIDGTLDMFGNSITNVGSLIGRSDALLAIQPGAGQEIRIGDDVSPLRIRIRDNANGDIAFYAADHTTATLVWSEASQYWQGLVPLNMRADIDMVGNDILNIGTLFGDATNPLVLRGGGAGQAIHFIASNAASRQFAIEQFNVQVLGTDVRLSVEDPTDTGEAVNAVYVFNGITSLFDLRISTSARKYKSNIVAAPELADLDLEPVRFHHDGDDKDYIGFIADDMPDEDAIVRTKGEIENYDLRAVVAILAAKVNRLEGA